MTRQEYRFLTVTEDMTVGEAFWKNLQNGYVTLVVVDRNDKFKGIVGQAEFGNNRDLDADAKVSEIMNRNCTVIRKSGDEDIYSLAREIYLTRNMEYLPVVTEDGDFVDYFSRARAFYYDYYRRGILPRMNYATNIMAAAKAAKSLGGDCVSVIEFGVAAGSGLLNAQFHSREIERITGIKIQVYGFDTGEGLPQTEKEKPGENVRFFYTPGDYKMNKQVLSDRLEDRTKLVLGNIEDTLPDFIEKETPYPIGAIFVDMDTYEAAKCILDWLGKYPASECFLPRIFMYFDDVAPQFGNKGEDKAIKEFNLENKGSMDIAPEGVETDMLKWLYDCDNDWMFRLDDRYARARMKICHRILDKRYDRNMDLKEGIKSLEILNSTL